MFGIKIVTAKLIVIIGSTQMNVQSTKRISLSFRVKRQPSWELMCCLNSQSMVLWQGKQHQAVHRPSCKGCSYSQALYNFWHTRESLTRVCQLRAYPGIRNKMQRIVGHVGPRASSCKKDIKSGRHAKDHEKLEEEIKKHKSEGENARASSEWTRTEWQLFSCLLYFSLPSENKICHSLPITLNK